MKKRQIALGMAAVLLASGLAACGGAKKAERLKRQPRRQRRVRKMPMRKGKRMKV